jgi:hypothetical protein
MPLNGMARSIAADYLVGCPLRLINYITLLASGQLAARDEVT